MSQSQEVPRGSKRPTGLTVISVLWILGGAFDGFEVVGNLPFPLQPFPLWGANGFIVLLIGSESVLAVFSIAVAIGLLQKRRWSYSAGLALPLVGLALNLVTFGFAALIPDLLNPSIFASLAIALVWVAVVWTYLRRSYVRDFLGVRAP